MFDHYNESYKRFFHMVLLATLIKKSICFNLNSGSTYQANEKNEHSVKRSFPTWHQLTPSQA